MGIAMIVEEILLEDGHSIIGPADRIETAITLIETEEIDAAILDINLAGLSGAPIAACLAARRIPFLFTTGHDRSAALNDYGDRPVLQKPFTASQLSAAIAALLPDRA
jgi:DNA-binding response OmpR family regulator